MTWRRLPANAAVLAVASAILVAACSSGKASKASAPPSSVTSTAAPVPAAAASTTLTSSPTPGRNPLASGPPYDRTSGPSGSGCTPPDAATLPAGWWAGKLDNVAGTSFDFHLRCWFSGQAAIKAGNEDGKGPVEDDYYVRDTPKVFKETFAAGTTPASCVGDANRPFDCTVGDVLGLYGSGATSATVAGQEVTAFSTVWLHVAADGKPDYLYMQFTP
jgi:hypothetical protein